MKILCVIDILGSGGAQRQLVNLAIGFKERGHSVSFLVYHHHDFYVDTLIQSNIDVNEIIEPNYFRRLIKMRRFIRMGDFGAVLSFLEASNFICEFSGFPLRKWKLVVGERSANPLILKSIKLRLFRWFHLFADHVVANSNENIRMVRMINPLLKNCHVIYNTVNFEHWKPDVNYIPFKNRKFKLIVAASHRYLKNLNGLIEGVNLLSEKEKEQLLIEWYGDKIVGEYFDNSYPEAIKLIDKFNLSNLFIFHPAIHNLPDVIKTANAVGLFSFYEGLPNIICEAMSAGKPVIASNVSDIRILINNENLICDPHSPNSIKSVISYLLLCNEQEYKEISNQNILSAKTFFDKNQIVNKYLKLME